MFHDTRLKTNTFSFLYVKMSKVLLAWTFLVVYVYIRHKVFSTCFSFFMFLYVYRP